jgi:tripartite-type tricarboxylate transporter receptor subunit TctC
VRVIVPLAPGGATDIQARLFSQKMAEEFGRAFLVENRPGAGESLALQTLRSAPADGHLLLVVTPTFTINPAFATSADLNYDPARDFAPLSLASKAPYLVVVGPGSSARTMGEFLASARANPGAVTFGTGGVGSPLHLSALWFATATGARMTVVHYKGTGPSLNDTLAGQIHGTFGNPISTLPMVKSGKLRALAVTSLNRSRANPELPTVAETVVPGFDVTTWHGWVAARTTPAELSTRIATALARIVASPQVTEKLLAEGAEPVGNTPEQFAQFLTAETQRWRKLVQETGARPE